jgi:hypothetical protein
MEPCSECGNRAVTARQYDGVTVLECDLCGALGGTRAAVQQVEEARLARAAGIDPRVFSLHRAIGALPSLQVHAAGAGDAMSQRLPFVSWQVVDARGLVQLENLTKSLQLAAPSLGVPWCIQVEFRTALTFVLQPQVRDGVADIRLAQADLPILAHAIARDSRLQWWRH